MKTKTTKYYHKNSDMIAFRRVERSSGYSYECTYDENGNVLTYKNSNGYFEIKGKSVTKEEYYNFINTLNRPCVGKKVIVDGIEYELK